MLWVVNFGSFSVLTKCNIFEVSVKKTSQIFNNIKIQSSKSFAGINAVNHTEQGGELCDGTRGDAWIYLCYISLGRWSGLFRKGWMTPVWTRVWYTAKQFLESRTHKGIWQCEQWDSVRTSQPLLVRFLRSLQKRHRFFFLSMFGSTLWISAS